VRLHLAALGHPLLGDQRYGGPDTFRGHSLSGHLLHAALLRLRHPITGVLLDLSAPLPPQMTAVLDAPAEPTGAHNE
jgi:23S rRNA pseudouridine1911/1915/1917 synthase